MKALAEQIADIDGVNIYGRVVGVRGLMVEIAGPIHAMSVGARIVIETGTNRFIPAEVIGFSGDNAVVMPFAGLEGVRRGCRAVIANAASMVRPSIGWLGRVVNAMGEPIDGKGPLPQGPAPMPYRAAPPPAHSRKRVGAPLDLGVRSMNTFLTCCRGQRMGIFAGSGVGKSTLLGMLARGTAADVVVVGLVGERGREVREFLEDDLGAARDKVTAVVATSDEPAMLRLRAAYTATRVAEYWRDQGKDVLLLVDSLTRFAMAAREIGLAAGEPPATRGYPPSVFAELPRLLERAGPGATGTITALYTVLVEGDDTVSDPVADNARGILDGHIVLSRRLAAAGHYPTIDILESASRLAGKVCTPDKLALAGTARRLLAAYAGAKELIEIGAYAPGADPDVDEALALRPALNAFLQQPVGEIADPELSWQQLEAVLGGGSDPNGTPA